jgi:hypothetical protein
MRCSLSSVRLSSFSPSVSSWYSSSALVDLGTGTSYALRLTPLTVPLSSPIASLRLAAATLCSVIAKLIYPSPGMQIPASAGDSAGEFGVGLVVVLLGVIEKERELRARAGFTFGMLPSPLSFLWRD